MYIWNMDDNNNIVYYIVLGVIYLLSRIFGKKKKKVKPAVKPVPERTIEPPTAQKEVAETLSFEDILRELSGGAKPKPEPEPETIPYPELGGERELQQVDKPSYQLDEIDEIAVDYEVPKAIGYEALPEPNLVSKKDHINIYERADSFKIKQKEEIDYLENLYLPDGVAKAFVMSEIFARKYE